MTNGWDHLKSAEVHERARLDAIDSLDLLPVDRTSGALEAILQSVAAIFNVPIALVTLLDSTHQHFKAQIGLDGLTMTPREVSFCTRAIESDEVFEVQDASIDLRFRDNPLVTGHPNIRYYAGAPMQTSDGFRLGTVCVIDHYPRRLSTAQLQVLQSLADAAVAVLEEHRSIRSEKRWVQGILDSIDDCVVSTDVLGVIDYVNPAAVAVLNQSASSLVGRHIANVLQLRRDDEPVRHPILEALETGRPASIPQGCFLESPDRLAVEIDDSVAPVFDQQGRLLGAVMVFRDVTAERETQRQLEYYGTRDPLTDALNRHSFERALDGRLADVTHDEAMTTRGAVLYADLDRFKGVNDELGHAVGDQLLQQVALTMAARIENVGLFSRIGGDEFGILLAPMTPTQVMHTAQDLLTSLAELRLTFADQRVNVGASIGMVMLDDPGLTVAETLRRADIACYAAKNAGGDQARWFDGTAEDIEEWTGSLKWMNIVEDALQHDAFSLFGQHISPVDDSLPSSIEVLLRLDLEGRTVTPSAFMPAVERFLLGRRLDEWVLTHTLEALAAGSSRLDQVEAVHLNLCAQTLGDTNTVDRFVELITASGIDPSKLCFEITESNALANFENALAFITGLKSIGCQIALDDFGRGFASFEYLKRLPIDIVKIDGMFVIDLESDPVSQHMVAAIQGVCDLLGMRTVAEGVETRATLPFLADIGLHSTQGFLNHRPEPLERSFSALAG